MNKRMSNKQGLAVIATVALIIVGFGIYIFIDDKLNETTYFITFDSNGGTRVTGQSVKINECVKKPLNPVRTGYEFEYWTLYGEEYDFSKPVKSHLNLVAKWQELE